MVEVVKISKDGHLLKIKEISDLTRDTQRLWDEDE